MSQPTLKSITDPLLGLSDFPHRLALSFPALSIEVRSNSPQLVDWLNSYFVEFVSEPCANPVVIHALECEDQPLDLNLTVKTPDPGKTRIKEAWTDLPGGRIVRKVLTGMVFYFGGEVNLAAGRCMANNSQIINFVNNRLIQHELETGSLLYHAAGIANKGLGIAISGFSGAGKSSLALRMLNDHEQFVSNDRLMIRREENSLRMTGIPKQPRVNPGTLLSDPRFASIIDPDDRRAFEALHGTDLWNLERKYDLLIHQVFGSGRFVLSAELRAIIVLNWKRVNDPLRVRRTTAAQSPELLPAFMKDTGVFYLPSSAAPSVRSLQDYTDQLLDLEIVEISGGVDFQRAVEIGNELLQTADSIR